jgi:LCP family protein required for cell wall assembly
MRKALITTGIVVAGLVLVILVSAYIVINGYVGKVTYDPGTVTAAPEAPQDIQDTFDVPDIENAGTTDSPKTEIELLEQRIRENLENNSTPLMYDNDVFNILLVGIDTSQDSDVGNSDTMMLLSFNRKTSDIVATSLLRDIYLSIPGYKQGHRLNSAYLMGGPALLLKTVQENFKIKVDKYIAVNFYSFMKIIDQIGGVSVDVSDAEIKVANFYIRQLNGLLGLSREDGVLVSAGEQNLSGKQALGFARIRYVGNADFGRTDRQRLVMKLVFDKIKKMNLIQLNDLLNTYLPEVRTNLAQGELFSLVLSIPTYAKYSLDSWYVPMDGSFSYLIIRGMSVLGIDFKENIAEMQKRIYG